MELMVLGLGVRFKSSWLRVHRLYTVVDCELMPLAEVLDLRTNTALNCEAVPRSARIQGP